MKTIIVATDFSDNANNAFNYAAVLAAYTKAKIILFNAFQLPVHASNTLFAPAIVDEIVQSNKASLENLASEASNKFGITVEARAELTIVTDELEKLVPEVKADLVVMGMHSNDWSDRLFGNTTTAVIRIAKYPVLVVPQYASFHGIKKILYAFDNNCLYSTSKLSMLKDFASNFKAEVQVFHVEPPRTFVAYDKDIIAKDTSKVEVALNGIEHIYKDVEQENLIEGIEKGIEEFDADMLAMAPHRLSFWEGLLNQSTTRTMALRTHIPLLVLPNSTIANYN